MNGIVDAAHSSTVYAAALAYAKLGISVLPCVGKKPAVTYWQPFQKRAASAGIIRNWHESGLLHNVGIICGQVSGGLVVIDLDGDQAIEAFKIRFPGYDNTYSVISGSGHGMHLYYRCVTSAPFWPPTTRVVGTPFGNIELRADGCYVIAPPSIHPDSGQPYRIANDRDIAFVVGELRPVVEWIKSLMRQKHGGTLPPASGKVHRATAYGLAALRGESADVARALPGERNNRLYRAALKLGSLIRDGKLDRPTVERELLAAASSLINDDGEAATLKTIASGLNRGMESSREQRH
jgi:Bifunctional DNA primase/polymerase, N-terminal